MSTTLGHRIRDLRTAQGLTLAELSDRSGVSVSYLNDIEHDRRVPTLSRLQAIAEGLGLNARRLLEGVEPFDA